MRIGVDIDGCLAEFNGAYIDLIAQLTGRQLPKPSDTYPDQWSYDVAGGVTKEEANYLWRLIGLAEFKFWQRLPEMEGAQDALGKLIDLDMNGSYVYFITSRPGADAKAQTEAWLRRVALDPDWIPTVLIASDKGPIARGLELDLFLDDKPENCEAVRQASPKTRVVMVAAPWNRGVQLSGVERAPSVLAALEDVN